jgi:hypothetical protein
MEGLHPLTADIPCRPFGAERKEGAKQLLFSPLLFFHSIPHLLTLQLLRLTSAKHGNRKMAKSFLLSVLLYFYSRRLSKRSIWIA